MKGLFKFTYDYYEWEELIAVSKSPEKLCDRFLKEESEHKLTQCKLEHAQMSDKEEFHYMIADVEYI